MRFGKALLCVVALTAALILASCGGAGGGSGSGGDAGIYVVDAGNNQIVWLYDMNATFFSRFNSAISGVTHIVNGYVDHSGKIYVIDADNFNVVRFDDLGAGHRVVIGSQGTGVHQFVNPVRVTADYNGRIFVVDAGQNKLIRIPSNAGVWDSLDLSIWFSASDQPDVKFDRFGHIYLAGGSKVVQLQGFTATGAQTFGSLGSGTGQFNGLTSVAFDDQAHLYLADGGNNRIVKINSIAGGGWTEFGTAGSGTNQFDNPAGIGVDHLGKIYISDGNNHRLVRIDDMSGANWTELSGVPGSAFGQTLSVYPYVPGF